MNASVVIPSKSTEDVLTVRSLPEGVDEVIISDVAGPSRARNDGIRRARNDVIVLMDDDLRFDGGWFESLVEQTVANPDCVFAARGTGILADVNWPDGFTAGMTRVMTFHQAAWEAVGGFDWPDHIPSDPDYGSDTDYLMSAYENGFKVCPLEHEWDHEDEPDEYTFQQNAMWLLWLTRRHPRLIVPRLPGILSRSLG